MDIGIAIAKPIRILECGRNAMINCLKYRLCSRAFTNVLRIEGFSLIIKN
jgi:hypothetical protein